MERKYQDREWLREKYVDEKLFGTEIAEMCDVHYTTIYNWLRKFDIEVRGRGTPPNHLELSNELWELLNGSLLGDGCIHLAHHGKSASYEERDNHREYLTWLSDLLFGLGVESRNIKKEKKGTFVLGTKYYRELVEVRDKWYPSGVKEVPDDIELAPSTLLNWFIGDGSYTPGAQGDLRLNVLCENMREGLPTLKEKLEKLGISCTINSTGIRIRNSHQDNFFNYILSNGVEIPPCYEYKFPEEVVS